MNFVSGGQSPVGYSTSNQESHAHEKSSRPASNLSNQSARDSNQDGFLQFTLNSNFAATAKQQQLHLMSASISSRTQKEMYKNELAKVWELIYEERQRCCKLEKSFNALLIEKERLSIALSEQEIYFREREAQLHI